MLSHVHLRNELNSWNFHGIMNISGLLQVNMKPKLFRNLTVLYLKYNHINGLVECKQPA